MLDRRVSRQMPGALRVGDRLTSPFRSCRRNHFAVGHHRLVRRFHTTVQPGVRHAVVGSVHSHKPLFTLLTSVS